MTQTRVPATVYHAAALEGLLPHRYPFLLVDRIEVADPGKRVVGHKMLTGGEWWLEGTATAHMPFTLVLEALAQTGGALLPDLMSTAPGGVAYFLGADRVRCREAARAGDELLLEVTLAQWRRGVCRARGRATVGRRLVLTAELTTVVRSTA